MFGPGAARGRGDSAPGERGLRRRRRGCPGRVDNLAPRAPAPTSPPLLCPRAPRVPPSWGALATARGGGAWPRRSRSILAPAARRPGLPGPGSPARPRPRPVPSPPGHVPRGGRPLAGRAGAGLARRRRRARGCHGNRQRPPPQQGRPQRQRRPRLGAAQCGGERRRRGRAGEAGAARRPQHGGRLLELQQPVRHILAAPVLQR